MASDVTADLLVVAEDLLAWIESIGVNGLTEPFGPRVEAGPCFCDELEENQPPPCGYCSLTRARAAIRAARGEA